MRKVIDDSDLGGKEKKLLRWRYVFKRTLEEVGREFVVSRERIRQMEQRTIIKLDK